MRESLRRTVVMFGVVRIRIVCLTILMETLCFASGPTTASGQAEPPSVARSEWQQEIGSLIIWREPIAWPAPESIIKDLRSKDDQVRLKALTLIGWDQRPAAPHEKVITPEHIRLMYAALGDNDDEQAIIAIDDPNRQMNYAAAGIPTSKGWTRVAVFSCWCKYGPSLEEFVQLRPAFAPNRGQERRRFEMVLRASGGGSGIYGEDEAHFRLRNGKLHRVLSFTSEIRRSNAGYSGACNMSHATPSCLSLEKRWFIETVLVEARGECEVSDDNSDFAVSKLLESRCLQKVTCRTYKWDEQRFQYTASGAAKPCGKRILAGSR